MPQLNVASVFEALSAAVPERDCIIHRGRRSSWREVNERTRRLANYLLGRGLGEVRTPRAQLQGFESGQDHLALYLYNGREYLEGMLGAFKSRVAPVNVNYRYVDAELVHLLRDANARAIIYHASFAPTLASIRAQLPQLEVLIQVADESQHPLLPGAVDYEAALASASAERPEVAWSPDDLYILYTGGTTGMPKGVLWRQHDIMFAGFGGRGKIVSGKATEQDIVDRLPMHDPPPRILTTAPMMHGAGHWTAFNAFHGGGAVVMQDNVQRLDAHDVLRTAEREQVSGLLLVGDAFARPIVDALREHRYELAQLKLIVTSGAPLHTTLKHQLLELLPHVPLADALGSSEAGSQAVQLSTNAGEVQTGTFIAAPGACVLSDDLSRQLAPGDAELGWFAQQGNVPLGYLGDPDKTAKTFPVIGGVRYSVPGDRARILQNGQVEVLGRDSVTINSGGEKIFAEEVERALKQHASVYDAVVCGRPSERWGQEVCAIVQLRPEAKASVEELLAECAKHIARYKLPKAVVFRAHITRSPSGKADYRWAKAEIAAAAELH